MASTPFLSGKIVEEARSISKRKPKEYRGGTAYIAGVLTGLEVALLILQRDGGNLPTGHLHEVKTIALEAFGKIKAGA